MAKNSKLVRYKFEIFVHKIRKLIKNKKSHVSFNKTSQVIFITVSFSFVFEQSDDCTVKTYINAVISKYNLPIN